MAVLEKRKGRGAASLQGATAGAALGTAIAPGIGTAIGGARRCWGRSIGW